MTCTHLYLIIDYHCSFSTLGRSQTTHDSALFPDATTLENLDQSRNKTDVKPPKISLALSQEKLKGLFHGASTCT